MPRPSVFATKSYAAVFAETKSSGGLLIVDATAEWCQPCKVMDRVTWADASVVSWIATNAVAIQIDVDEEKDVAASLGIRSMPTVLVLRGGVEVDRVVGLKKPTELLSWLSGLQHGETSLDRARAAANAEPKSMQARMALARTLANSRRFEEATEEYVWLWQHMVVKDPAMVGVRNSFLLMEIGQLMQAHLPARARFAELRDALAPNGVPALTTPDAVGDWVSLCLTLGEEDRVVSWFDALQTLPDDRELEFVLRLRLVPILTKRGRWSDMSRLFRDPIAILRFTHDRLTEATKQELPSEMAEMRPKMLEHLEGSLRRDAALMVTSLLAAKRSGEARDVLAEARKLLPGDELERTLREMTEKAGVDLGAA